MQGKFIVFYGVNNLGKTTQAKKLVEKLQQQGHKAEYLKYALYYLEPSGPIINGYLREGNSYKLTPRELQIMQVLNRTQYEPILKSKLESGIHIVAEDYVGTGITWGMGAGVNENFLKKINSHLLKEDLAFLFEGQRFIQSIENGHAHEENNELIEKVRLAHQKIGKECDWQKIDANKSIEEISATIWKTVSKII